MHNINPINIYNANDVIKAILKILMLYSNYFLDKKMYKSGNTVSY